jgi:CheY-like chemotaxis protein/tRNA A-37 threonylcarbamoyl transferase component Bud32
MLKHRILLVDDDDLILLTLKMAFRNLGCELSTASNGQEALQLIVQLHPSLIISDWHMPVLDGLGLFLQVKNSPHTKDIPFIFLTTTDDPEVRAALLEIGVEDYWSKPFNAREVSVRAKRVLERLKKTDSTASKSKNIIKVIRKMSESGKHELINDRYILLELIGHGGMGLIYRAQDLNYDREVALKLLRHEYVTDLTEVRRFAREAATAMRMVHPNIITTYEYGLVPSGQAYIVMELLSGCSLGEKLKRLGRFTADYTIKVMLPVCRAVAEAHRQGVVHRDLKPNNIFLLEPDSEQPIVKVLDFGIAWLKDKDNSERLTSPAIIMGTPEYISPEQAAGEVPDNRSDIYSLGVLFYEFLTGSPPFDDSNKALFYHLTMPPKPIQWVIDIDDWLAEIVMKMLAKDPSDRPQSVEEIMEVLEWRQ